MHITHWSIRLDAWVLYRTIRKVLGVGGPVCLAEMPSWTLGHQKVGADLVVGAGPGEISEAVDLDRSQAAV